MCFLSQNLHDKEEKNNVIAAPDVTPELRQRALAQCANMLDKMGHEAVAEGMI
jgi:hypothetical protein